MDSTALLVAAALAATVVVVACAVVRIVPAGHRGVVTRAGRVARSRPSGLIIAAPVVERVVMVDLHARPIDPLSVAALTRDGADIRLTVSVLWSVVDPTLAACAVPDARSATADAVERTVHHLVANVELVSLLRDREALLKRLPVSALPLVRAWGVELVDVTLLDAEVRVGPELLRLLG